MRVLIAAGGTGGHIYPGIAVAKEVIRRDPESEVRFVGTARGLETRLVPKKTCVCPAPPEKFRPLIVTAVPPPVGPEVWARLLTTGLRFTTSKALPGTCVSKCRSSSLQRER